MNTRPAPPYELTKIKALRVRVDVIAIVSVILVGSVAEDMGKGV
jgi:hypothetical protein